MRMASFGPERKPPSQPHITHSAPSECAGYAEANDAGVWNTAVAVLRGVPSTEAEREQARQVATLPMRMGGLGLRSAQRCSMAAL